MILAVILATIAPEKMVFDSAINPALGLMLFATFLQIPIVSLGKIFLSLRFFAALFVANFLAVPLLVAAIIPFFTLEPIVLLGVLMVLLAPCIDYVITFAHLGRSDSRLLLAATPLLLIMQMLLLPFYLQLFIGNDTADQIQFSLFAQAFLWLIAIPFALATLVQLMMKKTLRNSSFPVFLELAVIFFTALVLFIVIASVVPKLGAARDSILQAIPLYITFSVTAPVLGWFIGKLFRLQDSMAGAIAFSTATRNSLVIMPLALAIPGAIPVLPAVIMGQMIIELLAQLVYIRLALWKIKPVQSIPR